MAPHLPVIFGGAELYFDDHRRFSVPLGTLAARAVCAGELPAWNPSLGLGIPLLADPQTLALYPGLLLACWLPASHALGLLFVLHLGILAAGMALLLADLGGDDGQRVGGPLAAAVGAVVGLCGPAVSWLTSGPYLVTLAFFPWVLLAARRLGRVDAGDWRAVGAAAAGLGAALGLAARGGDVPGALCQALVAVVVWRSAGGGARRTVVGLAGAGALALIIGAPAWAPLAWYLGRSVRAAGIDPREAGLWSMHPGELVGLLAPNPLGLPLPENTFWPLSWIGRPRLFVHSLYQSALLAAFAVAAVIWSWRRDRAVRALAIAALVLLIVATGATTPLWWVTGGLFRYVRYPSKLVPYALLLLAALGGLGLTQALARSSSPDASADARRRPAVIAGALAIFAGLLALALPALQSRLARAAGAEAELAGAAAEQLRDGTLVAAVFAALGALLLFARTRPAGPGAALVGRHGAALLAAILVADAATAGTQLWWTAPAPRPYERPAWLPPAAPGGARAIRAAELDRGLLLWRDATGYLRDQARNERLLQPAAGAALDVGLLEGYGLTLGDLHARLSRIYASDPTTLAEVTGADRLLVPAAPVQAWVRRGVVQRRLELVTPLPAEGAAVLRPTRPMPRAHTATDYHLLPESQVMDRVLSGAFRRGPVITRDEWLDGGRLHRAPTATPPALEPPRPGRAPQPISPAAWSPTAVRFDVDRPTPTLLVMMDAFAEGWHATVDGRPTPILRANAVGRAVPVPAGAHRVEFSFDVPAFRWAARLPLAGWLLALTLLVTGGARRGRAA